MWCTTIRWMRPRTKRKASEILPHFDVCVIGGGPAGIAAAMRAVDYRKTVCIIEKSRVGGADFWNGALQSKTMWEMSKFTDKVRSGFPARFLDVQASNCLGHLTIDEEQMRRTLLSASEFREQQVLTALRDANVRLIRGSGMFASPNEVNVHDQQSGEYNIITADYFIIATGSLPRAHPHFPADGKRIITSDEIMTKAIPKSMVIVGAGVIGCEFASIYANFGQTIVHIIDKAPRILPMEDADIALFVQRKLEAKGVIVHHEASLFDLQSWEDEGVEGVQYTIKKFKTGELSSGNVDIALMAIGRLPNYRSLGLENTKCKVTDGRLDIDKYQRCKPYTHIYAVGDATMDIALVNMGEAEARMAVDHIYSYKKEVEPKIDNLSTIMFLDEEVAAVGLNEQQCQQRNIAYVMARYGYAYVSRAVAMGDTKGFIKIIVTNDREKRVLGVRAVGPHASSIVELASLAIHNNQSAYELAELMTAYPAITQGFQECLRMLLSRSILKPNSDLEALSDDVSEQLVLTEWVPAGFIRGRSYQNVKTSS